MAIWKPGYEDDIFMPEVDQMLASCGQIKSYKENTVIFTPGTDIEGIYYLHSGYTSHSMVNEDGNIKLLYYLSPGYYFGDTAYFLDVETSLISKAETDVVFYYLSSEILMNLLATSEAFRHSLLLNFSAKLITARYELSNVSFSSTKERILRFFCSAVNSRVLIDKEWLPLTRQLNQTEIGEIVGATRVTVNRQIAELCIEGKLRIHKGRIHVNYGVWQSHNKQPLY